MTTYTPANREWWVQRWIEVLESFGWARRMERARIYAREGNVLKMEFQDAKVFAKVQGSAPEPYEVTLNLDPFDDEQWGYVVESMAEQAIYSAKLLAGEMPPSIESVFTNNGLSLFPFTKFDIHSRCNCPDPVNPCKHIGAVYYLLGDRFSQDPFVLFQLRGRTKAQILDVLRQQRQMHHQSDVVLPEPPQVKPLSSDRLWQYDAPLDPSLVVIVPPASQETVLDTLGNIPGEADETALQALKSIYATASLAAVGQAMNVGQSDA
ncbi:metal-binding protein [filamentous cyanobacterium LEGE 11480]|uniref:Metal-binding protein n=1 Tax=Romeriopsis navalis LEGE 11480 TaxID=2777977 RepID=A0A928VKY0_9CYAN|nr:metal-binding protein [Romeriopsis navalis]MBE9030225.1 metal-binding protein [Romeriopsis navalis LEGE 11480]